MPVYPASHTDATGGVDVEAWTQSTVSAMETLSLSSGVTPAVVSTSTAPILGTAVTLDIPLDAETPSRRRDAPEVAADATEGDGKFPVYRTREPRRRDSMKRREALLKGKEGSRRRQKWENDRLMGNPWVEAPEPHDWEPRPVYPVHSVPYFLAPLWDERHAKAERRAADERRRRQARQGPLVPRNLRETLKRARGAKSLLQDLEEQVRDFVEKEQERRRKRDSGAESPTDADFDKLETSDSEEDEIVFVGRRGPPTGAQRKRANTLEADRMVFDTLEADKSGNFGRWLVHEIASYYDLRTWSVTRGSPARREAYVGFKSKPSKRKLGCGDDALGAAALPTPLYCMV